MVRNISSKKFLSLYLFESWRISKEFMIFGFILFFVKEILPPSPATEMATIISFILIGVGSFLTSGFYFVESKERRDIAILASFFEKDEISEMFRSRLENKLADLGRAIIESEERGERGTASHTALKHQFDKVFTAAKRQLILHSDDEQKRFYIRGGQLIREPAI